MFYFQQIDRNVLNSARDTIAMSCAKIEGVLKSKTELQQSNISVSEMVNVLMMLSLHFSKQIFL